MANGQVVLVTTEGLSGGPPTRTVYYVAEEDPAEAEAIIAKFMAPNEKVEAYGPLPEAAVKALRLKPGEFIQPVRRSMRIVFQMQFPPGPVGPERRCWATQPHMIGP